MARGYLGKISAVVTVNTSDVAPKLNAGAKQFASFARSTQSTISSAMSNAGKSFDQIFTPLQKLQRALAAANKDPLNLNIDTSKVEKLVLAANQLAKPLGESTKQFAALAGSVQRQFSPALEGVQAGMANLRSQIEAGTSIGSAQFRGLAADVELVNGALGRLKEQAALSAKLFTGQELTFVRPESIDSLNRLAAAQQKLAAAPATTRSSPIARDLLEDSQILSKQIENISARIERLRAQGLDITVSQAGLDLAVRRVNEVATLLDQITEAPKEIKIEVNADNLIARAKAQQEFYAESERLQKQAAADAAAPLIARARAEQEYYEESKRLREQAAADEKRIQNQAAADAAAPLIRRARAQQDFYEESKRLREQAAADEKRFQDQAATDDASPLIRRAAAQREFYAESQRLREQAAADEKRLQEQSAADAAAPLIRRAAAQQEFYAESKRLREQAVADEKRIQSEAAADAAAPLIRRAAAQREFYAESQRLREQAAADEKRIQNQDATDAASPLIRRAAAQREFYAESQRLREQAAADEKRLQDQAAADAAAPLIRRTKAQQEFYAESQRLREQAAADERRIQNQDATDAAAPLIRRAAAQREFEAESKRLREQAAADEKRLQDQAAADAAAALIRRAAAEQEFYAESKRLQEQAAADEAAPLIRRARGEMDFEAENARLLGASREGADLGLNLDDPSRQIEQLRSGIVSVKGQIDSLPASIRSQLLPAIKAAEAEFLRLRNSPDATAEEIDNAAAAVRRLGANASAAGRLTQTFAESLNASKLATAEARYSALRSLLLATGKDAGRAGVLVDKLGAAIGRAAASGNFSALAKEINEIEKEAIQASEAVLGISAKSVASKVNRAGDISRGGVDKFSLALNQAAFAVDDFLSSTGGLEFKLRAVSNNITQLGFVAGGTKGLFIGLAAVIGGQLAVAITKWINDGRSAEDQTKALNESLSKQKSLVEGLAAAYEKVADAVRDAGLSERGRRDAGVRRQVEDIQRQQKQARDERILGLDVGVAAARGSVAKAERELGASTTVGQRARAELELNAARQRQREEERRALEQAGSPLGGIREAVISEITSQIERETQGAFAGARAAAAASGGFGGQGAFAAARETERRNNERIAALQGIGGSPEEAIAALDERINQLVKSGASGDVILPLQQLRERILVYTKQLEGDRLASRISEGVLRIVDAMESANSDISSAFDGVRGASAIESDLASFGETLAQFQRAAADAAGRGDVGQVQAINEDINAIKAHIAALQDAAAAVRIFGSELQRLSQSVAQDLSSLEQRAEDARRADVGAGTDASRQQRDQAESDARDARRAQRQFEDQRASATERFEQDARANNDPRFRRVREIDAMLAVPMNEVGADGRTRGGTAQERDAARTERRALQESIDNSVDNDPAVAEARRQRDAMTARAQEAQSIDRGRELSLTPGQRASEQLNQELQDIRNYFSRAAEESSGLPEDVAKIRGKMDEALARAEEDAMRQVAPMTVGMADARQNAILQGPSRAALGASDVTTMQGQAELNRLLRGDDPNKNVDLVELQREANKLLEAISKKENPVI